MSTDRYTNRSGEPPPPQSPKLRQTLSSISGSANNVTRQ